MSGVLFFDGGCGMCTRSVYFIKRLDRAGTVQIVPFQQSGSEERLGLDPARMYTSSWWLADTGEVHGGAAGINAALSAALGTRLPWLIYRIPGVRQLQNAAYRWIAGHRYRFPGTTPHCESHPVAC
jgi:predicted DCC family thiol-disulfide oxidoreductase YuxK